ncbi:SPFH domain-containing protein [Actinokineospora sp. G85]|uniref:SPFH domain-containing protein n=1 Tax=Actinokineospora sp. G85 TaxID=3406626 RepID=UPI003C72DC7D
MKRRFATVLATTGLALTACSIGNTNASEVALHYGAGPLDSRTFVACVQPATRSIDDVNDDHYYYPAGARDFTFGDGEGLDAAALVSTTKDSQEIKVSGTIKFTLNTDCSEFTDPTGKKWPGGKLQMFHELIGYKYEPAEEGGGQPGKWEELLRNYIGASLSRATDNQALQYGWQQLYSDTASKAKWEQDVLAQLPATLMTLTQGVDLFHIDAVLLQKPSINPQLADGLSQKQAAELRAQAVEVDKQAAANFPGGIAAYQAYQQQQAVNEAIKAGRVQVLPIPRGPRSSSAASEPQGRRVSAPAAPCRCQGAGGRPADS